MPCAGPAGPRGPQGPPGVQGGEGPEVRENARVRGCVLYMYVRVNVCIRED